MTTYSDEQLRIIQELLDIQQDHLDQMDDSLSNAEFMKMAKSFLFNAGGDLSEAVAMFGGRDHAIQFLSNMGDRSAIVQAEALQYVLDGYLDFFPYHGENTDKSMAVDMLADIRPNQEVIAQMHPSFMEALGGQHVYLMDADHAGLVAGSDDHYTSHIIMGDNDSDLVVKGFGDRHSNSSYEINILAGDGNDTIRA